MTRDLRDLRDSQVKSKVCSACGKTKNIKEFRWSVWTADGFSAVCLTCMKRVESVQFGRFVTIDDYVGKIMQIIDPLIPESVKEEPYLAVQDHLSRLLRHMLRDDKVRNNLLRDSR